MNRNYETYLSNTSVEIEQLFDSDQADRQKITNDPAEGLKIRQRDEQRLQAAKELVAKGNITNSSDLNKLAIIFLHSDTADDYRQALGLTTKAVEAGLPPRQSLIPQATDRLMIQEQLDKGVPLSELSQKYGTQTRYDETGKTIKPKLDGTASKEEFEKFGMSQPIL